MFELKLLDYPKILNILSEYAYLDITKENILKYEPLIDEGLIFRLLNEAYEAKNIIYRLGDLELYNFNLEFTINRIRIGSQLNVNELLEIKKLIMNSSKIESFSSKSKSLDIKEEYLDGYFNKLDSLKDVKVLIDKTIDFEGNILDDASPELYKIRKNIKLLENEVTQKLNQLIREYGSKVAESIVTIRNGHRVIPIKSEAKSSIKGVIYDESSSGQTVYIEPYSCAEIEGKILVLKSEESEEINKILSEVSIAISEYYEQIKNNYDLVLTLDDIFARGAYAKSIDAEMPILSEDINLIDSRHPLIDKDIVVPNTIRLLNKKTMIITGPNTGGKTVVLKTLGLFSLMAQSGILLPLKEGSKIRIFNGVYADIGDEQSIEQSLSTFSSHMFRIAKIINEVDSNSLILLDELGSGTDPKEGASLAIAILNHLRSKGLYTLCTTHYPELKLYAYQNNDIENASVEFNADTLKPTYRLLIGISGKSNAFLISRRLGLNEDIIKEAEGVSLEFKDKESLLINNLENESIRLKDEIDNYELLKKNLEEDIRKNKEYLKTEKDKLHKKMDDITSKENEILEKTQVEANKLLDEIRALRKEAKSNLEIKENVLADLKGKTNSLYKDKYIKKNYSKKEINIGDNVRSILYNQVGVVTAIKNNKYTVLMGSISSTFKKTEIEYVEIEDNVKKAISKKSSSPILKANASSRLDLRGMRYEEAEAELDKFIDDAVLINLETVEIIHGFGTLALRNMVIKYCNTHNSIKGYRSGEEHEGGRGVTIVKLK